MPYTESYNHINNISLMKTTYTVRQNTLIGINRYGTYKTKEEAEARKVELEKTKEGIYIKENLK